MDNKQKKDVGFISSISHDLRTPVHIILGVVELLRSTTLNEKQQDLVSRLDRSSLNLLNLVDDILDYAKTDQNQIFMKESQIVIRKLMTEIVSSLEILARKKNLEIEMQINDDVPEKIIGVNLRLGQVLNNLIANAIEFTLQGQIKLTLEMIKNDKDNFRLHFCVSDSGGGMNADLIENIFQPFVQDSTTSEKGTGLGLAICENLVKLMKGKIGVESEIGSGTSFWFEIPLILPEKNQSNSEVEKGLNLDSIIESLSLYKINILVVDDSEDNRFLVNHFLSDDNIDIQESVDGLSAINKFKEHPFDLVLMDVQLPDMNGNEVIKKIRSFEQKMKRKRIPIITLSACALEKEVNKSLKAGSDVFITKPISRQKLREYVYKSLIYLRE